jgi:alkylhydroperoxidase/carboxymuconolactone decarboxylase family protein YurZ
MGSETPVRDTLTDMTAVSLSNCQLDPRELMIARLAALVASDAPTASYLLNTPSSMDAGVTIEDVQAILVAIAPVVGAPRIVDASLRITDALGFAIAILTEESEAVGATA